MENEQNTQTTEIDVEGGWIVTHHSHTWDTRERLDQLPQKIEQAQANLVEAQARVDDLTEQKVQVDTVSAGFKWAQTATLETPMDNASSTPVK